MEYSTSKLEETKEAIVNILTSDKIQLCTITPASLAKYNSNESDTTHKQQQNLNRDIQELNQLIIEKNIERDLPTIDLARQSYTASLKKQGAKKKRILKFTDKDLTDGVHPSTHLKHLWTSYMGPIIDKIMDKLSSKNDGEDNLSTDEDDGEQESWNFKRPHKH